MQAGYNRAVFFDDKKNAVRKVRAPSEKMPGNYRACGVHLQSVRQKVQQKTDRAVCVRVKR